MIYPIFQTEATHEERSIKLVTFTYMKTVDLLWVCAPQQLDAPQNKKKQHGIDAHP